MVQINVKLLTTMMVSLPPSSQSLTQLSLSLTLDDVGAYAFNLGELLPLCSDSWIKADHESENFFSSSDETSSNKDGSQLDHKLWIRETNGRTRKLYLPLFPPNELMKELERGIETGSLHSTRNDQVPYR